MGPEAAGNRASWGPSRPARHLEPSMLAEEKNWPKAILLNILGKVDDETRGTGPPFILKQMQTDRQIKGG